MQFGFWGAIVCVFAGCYDVRVTLMGSVRMSVDQELSSSNWSASAALAFNTPESAHPPAALSTPPKRTPPRLEAFRKGANDYNFFETVDYAHIPECYRKPPQPEEHIFSDPKRLNAWHNGRAFAADAWRRQCAKSGYRSPGSPLFKVVHATSTSTGAAPITAAAGSTPIFSSSRSSTPLRHSSELFVERYAKHDADVRRSRAGILASSTQSTPNGAAPITAAAASTPVTSPPPEFRSSSTKISDVRAHLNALAASRIAALARGRAARVVTARRSLAFLLARRFRSTPLRSLAATQLARTARSFLFHRRFRRRGERAAAAVTATAAIAALLLLLLLVASRSQHLRRQRRRSR